MLDFVVIGAAKCGTTSLYHYFRRHPKIFVPRIKETHYFSDDLDVSTFHKNYFNTINQNYVKELKENPEKLIHNSHISLKTDFDFIFSEKKGEKKCGDMSNSYLHSKKAPQNLKKYNPRIKIICILRDPIERSISHHNMLLRHGLTNNSYMEDIEYELNGGIRNWGDEKPPLLALGLYGKQLKRYMELFTSNQILIIEYSFYKSNQQTALNNIFSFLHLPSLKIKKETEIWVNSAGIPRFKKLNFAVAKYGLGTLVPFVKNNPLVKKLLFKKLRDSAINHKTLCLLNEYYSEDIYLLKSLTNIDVRNWSYINDN